MKVSVAAREKHKPQGTAGIWVRQSTIIRRMGGLEVWWKKGDGTAPGIEPALENERGGELINDVTPAGGIATGCVQGGVGFRGGETLVPEVNFKGGRGVCRCGIGWIGDGFHGCFVLRGKDYLELVDKGMDALCLAAVATGEMEWIADNDSHAAVAASEAQDGALIATGLRAFEGEQRLRDPEHVGERDADAAGTDVEAKPDRLGFAHAAMIARCHRHCGDVLLSRYPTLTSSGWGTRGSLAASETGLTIGAVF